jgi:hypothetical protein
MSWKEALRIPVGVLGAALLFIGVMLVGNWSYHNDFIRAAKGQPTLPSPNVYFYTAITTAQQIIGQNPSRHGLQICNSGGTNALWIMPNVATINTGAIVAPATNVGVPVPAVASNVQSCFTAPPGLSVGQAWQGQSTTTPVTVLEYP